MEKQKKKELVQKLKDACGATGVKVMKELLEAEIDECHRLNERARVDEFVTIQGEIKGHRKFIKLLTKEKKELDSK